MAKPVHEEQSVLDREGCCGSKYLYCEESSCARLALGSGRKDLLGEIRGAALVSALPVSGWRASAYDWAGHPGVSETRQWLGLRLLFRHSQPEHRRASASGTTEVRPPTCSLACLRRGQSRRCLL